MSDGDNATPGLADRARRMATTTINGLPELSGRLQAPRRGSAAADPTPADVEPAGQRQQSQHPRHRGRSDREGARRCQRYVRN